MKDCDHWAESEKETEKRKKQQNCNIFNEK